MKDAIIEAMYETKGVRGGLVKADNKAKRGWYNETTAALLCPLKDMDDFLADKAYVVSASLKPSFADRQSSLAAL